MRYLLIFTALLCCLLNGCAGDNFEFNPTAKDAPIDYGTNAPQR